MANHRLSVDNETKPTSFLRTLNTNTMTIRELIGQKALARALGVHSKTISRWRSAGKIPAPFIVDANRPYWTYQQIERWQSNDNSIVQREEHSRTLSDIA